MEVNPSISAEFPYRSKFIDVLGSKIHYIDEGTGDVLLFVHGMPTSSYLWRNVIPWVCERNRCIALDLIGMGQSDKPDIPYRVFDFIRYFEGFVEALNLKNITLVLHGYGSIIGFEYAKRHENNLKSLVFFESYIRHEMELKMAALPMQHLIHMMQSDDLNADKIINTNYFIDSIMPIGMMRKLTAKETDHYRSPFAQPEHRQLFWQYLQDLPIGKLAPNDVVELITSYSKWLAESPLSKLMFYAIPGFNTTIDTINWARNHFKNLKLVDIGESLHFFQETHPDIIGQQIADWL